MDDGLLVRHDALPRLDEAHRALNDHTPRPDMSPLTKRDVFVVDILNTCHKTLLRFFSIGGQKESQTVEALDIMHSQERQSIILITRESSLSVIAYGVHWACFHGYLEWVPSS